jgi:hypothetical protein
MSKSNNEVTNRRTQRRRTLAGVVNIKDQRDGAMLGRLVNVTTEGLMLVNSRPLATDTLYPVVLELPEPLDRTRRIELGMDCLWTSPTAPDADMFWSGCHILDISEAMLSHLMVLIESFGD